ncbi:hypothetical protein LIER_34381 [Lithospermum erythrorhizon]|uniref:Uncharacterized protein n=1 Tax=Lithospermum erythrorhizon TaxID=34254 RepID=A0AAV3RZC8_LITER
MTNFESPRTFKWSMAKSLAIYKPATIFSYSASLLVALKEKRRAYSNCSPSTPWIRIPSPALYRCWLRRHIILEPFRVSCPGPELQGLSEFYFYDKVN